MALKAEGDLPGAMAAFKAYAGLPSAAKAKEAQNQIAQIDMRLKNPPAAAPKPSARPAAAAAEMDLSKLPQGTDTGGSAPEKLPAPEGSAPAAAPEPKEKEKPAAGKDGGVQNAQPASTAQVQSLTAK